MNKFACAIMITAFTLLYQQFVSAAPMLPGLANKHPLSEEQTGLLLMGELRCAACHKSTESPLFERATPDLADVGARVAPEYLQRFLDSPSHEQPGTTMPDMLHALPAAQRKETAEALTHFLVSQSPGKFQFEAVEPKQVLPGKTLFHTIGCVACHGPLENKSNTPEPKAIVNLDHVPSKYSVDSLSKFLFQPKHVRPSGRMPDMKLTRSEANQVASYLLSKVQMRLSRIVLKDELVAKGKKAFQEQNCVACHKLGNIPPAPMLGELKSADLTLGCLSTKRSKSPFFNLNETQANAIRKSLSAKPELISEKLKVTHTLIAFNCNACHVRDGFGGVAAEHQEYFQTREKELGDEARIPPPLTQVGAKLQPVALKKMLFDGDSVRPYMLTRMPQFGELNLRHLPELFAKLDTIEKVDFSLPKAETRDAKEREREKAMRAAGRDLLGEKMLTCIACHTFNGKAAGHKGIELMTITERLQPSWYYHYMIEPSAFRPRTVMPTAWPGGKAMLKTVLNGHTKEQIEAIWYYLTLGTSAADPPGLRVVQTALEVKDATHTYRGRSSVAGFRGIAVGFPQKLNYSFNAETGTLSAIWAGDYIRVNRSGQGSGNFDPAEKHVALAQDVSFFDLPDEKTAWPLRPVMTKEAPVNPDPLYPKNRGYQFAGYFMDEQSIPTFMYRSGSVEIEDYSNVEVAQEKLRLVRTFSFHAPKGTTLWFRGLTGQFVVESKQQFKTKELRLNIPKVPTLVRPDSGDEKSSELLLQFIIPKGKSTQTLTYELLK
ncbi:MAG: cytochrome c [Zavarzinella sp.]